MPGQLVSQLKLMWLERSLLKLHLQLTGKPCPDGPPHHHPIGEPSKRFPKGADQTDRLRCLGPISFTQERKEVGGDAI